MQLQPCQSRQRCKPEKKRTCEKESRNPTTLKVTAKSLQTRCRNWQELYPCRKRSREQVKLIHSSVWGKSNDGTKSHKKQQIHPPMKETQQRAHTGQPSSRDGGRKMAIAPLARTSIQKLDLRFDEGLPPSHRLI